MQITGSLSLNEYERMVGGQAVKERKLYVKVHQFALLSYSQQESQEEAPVMAAEAAAAPAVDATAAAQPMKAKRSRS